MSRVARVVDGVMDHSRAVIVVMLVLTVGVGAGATAVDQSSSLDQFQTDSPAAEKLEYIQSNFSTGDDDTTIAQVILRDDNVLDRESLVETLDYQRALRENETVNRTLVDGTASVSIANVLATAHLRQEEGEDVRRVAAELQALNETVAEERAAVRARNETLDTTAGRLRAALTRLRSNPDLAPATAFEAVRANTSASVELNATDRATFERAARLLRGATSEAEAERAYRLGTRGVLATEYRTLQERATALERQGERLQTLADDLEGERADLRAVRNATLAEQRAALADLNESELDALIGQVLGDGGDGRAFAFMPTDYEVGSTEADATTILVTQRAETASSSQGAASDGLVEAQLAMEAIGEARGDYLVFGAGIISDEIDSSLGDSLVIVGPLALLFVLVALTVAYRDIVDIVLGLLGIGAVLVWTFGFMGWAGVSFNQILISVPVLLIGLSIDYAIHVFMRHREERTEGEGELSPRGSMRTALAGVGIALVYVTATTVIGFLSNLSSPVGPIQDFGVVASVGIVAALLVFTLLVPALKVEIDGLLESWGIDRRKRAFGTGGGAFSSVLAVGATAARRAPAAVILIAVLVSAGGVYGASQVDTSFDQEDFLAEDPPGWMDELPEPFRPGDYSAKSNLQFVNDNFVREDSQAQVLVEGDVTAPATLQRVDAAAEVAVEQSVIQTLSNGEADIRSPLSLMRTVAAEDEAFRATFEAADTDGDGVPDRDLTEVYDALYEAAPDRAGGVLYREGGEYRALRLVIAVEGGAGVDDVTADMRTVATELDGDGRTATATGSPVVNKEVQDDLLSTVIESLIITLVATFVFLMITYRVTEGSATLGVVTLLPVAFSVTWILGTMYVLDISFNVLTGLITSLTIGLGVAYSIHLSERYNQELERTGDVWASMERAVTGTGGALLGSAATTVGGFGTLTFAILPPLQQFGIITGLTIIYAFLASVLVLPSLLVVWTRYSGAVDVTVPDGTDLGGLATVVESDSNEAGAGATEPTAVRRLTRPVAAPGERIAVQVTVDGATGRTVVHEELPAEGELLETTPDAVDTASGATDLSVAWSDGATTLRYAVVVPADAPEGTELGFEGELVTADGRVAVEGDAAVTVVPDPFERIAATGDVTEHDLRDAHDRYETGDLSEGQLRRVHAAWVRGDVRPSELESPADD